MHSYKIGESMDEKADYSEDLVPIVLQSAFTVLDFPFFSHRVTTINRHTERGLGYDAHVPLELFTFFMQFKKPTKVGERSKGRISTDRDELVPSALGPHYFFQLHQYAKTKQHEQHNKLFEFNKTSKNGDIAAYVCPLYMDANSLQASIQLMMMERLRAFLTNSNIEFYRQSDIVILSRDGMLPQVSIKDMVGFRHYVTVPPHALITDTKTHFYSFDGQGENICFHSPMQVDGRNLFDWLVDLYERARTDSFSISDSVRFKRYAEVVEGFPAPDEVSAQTWMDFGDFLQLKYGLTLFGFVRPKNPLQ